MSENKSPENYIIRTRELATENEINIQHMLNSNSDVRLHPLSNFVGMKKLGVNLVKIPAGKESYTPHAHTIQEEFAFIVEGEGTLEVNGDKAPIAVGDFIGFPTDGASHQIYNTGNSELVYISAGERTATEIVNFPTHNKVGVFTNGQVQYFDADNGSVHSVREFLKPKD